MMVASRLATMNSLVCFLLASLTLVSARPISHDATRQLQQNSAPSDCYQTPTKSACESYTYPMSLSMSDLESLCTAMPDMTGCSVWTACKNGKVTDSTICNNVELLATICVSDGMSDMAGCSNYTTMCGNNSVIEECATYGPIKSMPTTAEAKKAVFGLCSSMSMSQCSECTKSSCPDPLSALSGACTDMPTMSQCSVYNKWCHANEGALSYYCGSNGGGVYTSGLPSMLMYFHERVSEIVLWREWVPRTDGEYAGTIIAVFSFGIFSMGMKTAVTILSIYWKSKAPSPSMHMYFLGSNRACPWWIPRRHQWWHNVIKAVIFGLSLVLDYWNMLIVMTFNVGLFCSVILGYVLGMFFFASHPENYTINLQMLTPPRTAVDCACPGNYKDANAKEGAEETNNLNYENKHCFKSSSEDSGIDALNHTACCPTMQ